MYKILFALSLLVYLVGAEADTDCQNDIAKMKSNGDDAKTALVCLNNRIEELQERLTSLETKINTDRNASLSEHDKIQSPFDLHQKKSVFLCDKLFTVFYDSFDQRYKKYVLFVNGVRRRVNIGGIRPENAENTQLVIRLLEYKEDKDAIVVDYTCKNIR